MQKAAQSSIPFYIEQFITDLKFLPEDRLSIIANGLPNEGNLSAIECIHAHVKESPNRIPQLFSLVICDMPYYSVMRHFRWVNLQHMFNRYGKNTYEVLGEIRTTIALMSLMYLELGEHGSKKNIENLIPIKDSTINEIPSSEKVAALDLEISDELVSLDALDRSDISSSLLEAQRRAAKAEKDLRDARINWAKTQTRLQAEASRGKKSVADQVMDAKQKSLGEVTSKYESDLTHKNEELKDVRVQLDVALTRLREIEEQGGATPERVMEISEEFRLEADRRVEDELSIAVRPWFARLEEMEIVQKKLEDLKGMSSEALRVAKEEARRNDILLNWELDRERSLKILEAEVADLDNLMCRVLKPSEKLKKMHSDTLKAMLDCRKQLSPSKPHGDVAKAIIAGIKKVKDTELSEVEYAVKKLADKGVFLNSEAEALIRIVENEKQFRYDQIHHKQSVQAQMMRKLHNQEPVDLLIDGYNFMFTADSLFGEKLKLSRNASGDAVFGEEGRKKLNQILVPVVAKFPKIDVHIFYDGLVKENRNPHPRISLWQPTYQRTGKGQADAEIAFVGLKRIRKSAMAVVVTNDNEIRKYADHFLSIRLFSDFLNTI